MTPNREDRDAFTVLAREIVAGKFSRTTTAIPEGAWDAAQKVIGRTLGASNETFIHPTVLRGLVENVATALSGHFDLGHKAAGGTMIPDDARNMVELAIDRQTLDLLAGMADQVVPKSPGLRVFLENISIFRSRKP